MKRNKKILTVITILLLIVCMAVPVSAAGKINKKKATLKVGQTLQLKVTGTKGKVKWKSSKKSVATVSSKGRVKAKKKGSATITAKVGKRNTLVKLPLKSHLLTVMVVLVEIQMRIQMLIPAVKRML